jgi:hypothetical protein
VGGVFVLVGDVLFLFYDEMGREIFECLLF